MILAATAAKTGPTDLPFNWFDLAVLLLLIFGFFRGRHNGMSKECIPLLQWLVLVPACAFLYPIAGQFYANMFHWDKLTSNVSGYLTLAFVILLIFNIVKKLFGERMEKSETFKKGEYFLGMVSGVVRMVCILIVVMALLNAPVYTKQDIAEHAAYVQKTYGGGTYSGDYFPNLQQVQEQVFQKSFFGPVTKNNLGMLLINNSNTKEPGQPLKLKVSLGK
jgi:uncharacterized membrane protein required for colicin V production